MAKSLTIHGLDDGLYQILRNRARAHGRSMNAELKALLSAALGQKPATTEGVSNPFDRFCGCWSEEEKVAFDESLAENRQIDADGWP